MDRIRNLKAVNVHYRYPDGNMAVSDVCCELETGKIIGLVGLSGSGKSTLGRLFKGLIDPIEGIFSSSATPVVHEHKSHVIQPATERMKLVGWGSAHPETQLFAATVWDDVAFGPMNQGLTGSELSERVKWALELVGLANGLEQKHPYSLSGGQRKRVALAGIVAMQNRFYVFDEPTAGLDSEGREDFIQLLVRLRDHGCGILWITHEIDLVSDIADNIWLMEDGRMMEQRQVDEYVDQYCG